MSDLPADRTPLVIAAEINMITHQTKKILLTSAIEIGRRLTEAKALVKHGEWGKWLEKSVSYSQKTAGRLIKLYEEYGSRLSDGTGGPNWTPVSNLTYTQALLLLRLPEEEREEFIAENDVPGMSKEELQQALREKNQAQQENKVLKKGMETIDSAITELKKERVQEVSAGGAAASNGEISAAAKVSLAGNPLSEPPASFTHNLPSEPDPGAAARYAERCDACRKTIADAFYALTTALTNLTYLDPGLKEEKRKEAQKLIDSLAETIKEWPPAKKPLKVIP